MTRTSRFDTSSCPRCPAFQESPKPSCKYGACDYPSDLDGVSFARSLPLEYLAKGCPLPTTKEDFHATL